jgi:hypothetical protein
VWGDMGSQKTGRKMVSTQKIEREKDVVCYCLFLFFLCFFLSSLLIPYIASPTSRLLVIE